MTRDEALTEAWNEIFGLAGHYWMIEQKDNQEAYGAEDYDSIDKALWDIVKHPTEYTAYIEC